jgi:hypothetical protein
VYGTEVLAPSVVSATIPLRRKTFCAFAYITRKEERDYHLDKASCQAEDADFPRGNLHMAWTKPLYDRVRVNQAGNALLTDGLDEERRSIELAVVNNWRSAHGFPLQCIKMTLLKRAKQIDSAAIVAQRLKRLPSIQAKLEREPTMKLSQMQDLGGCRAVVSTVVHVDRLVKRYQKAQSKNPRTRHEQTTVKDYIRYPKIDGYRGIHLIYKYRSDSKTRNIYNDQKIEIQIRSKLQHAWATAVEIVDAFTKQNLKSGLKLKLGDANWRRFFALMGSAIAIRERRPKVPEIPTDPGELKQELKALATKLNIVDVLSGLNIVLDKSMKDTGAASYLLKLDLQQRQVSWTTYTKTQLPKANDDYLTVEKETKDNPQILAVLVSVESIKALRTAYPNYYLDANQFIEAFRMAIK